MAGRALRVAMYSHDAMGLGHMRRNLLIAQTLAAPPLEATVLLLAGAHEIGGFCLPARVDFLSLPSLQKVGLDRYEPRRLCVSLDELTHLRQETIAAAVTAFRPDVLLVDNVPSGAGGELEATLRSLANNPAVRCVLGLRDVLDDPLVVRRQWEAANNESAIARFYDAVWVYGQPDVFDPIAEYGWTSETAVRTQFMGYLDQSLRLQSTERGTNWSQVPEQPYVVCVVGGGQDGEQLAQAFLQADLPPDLSGVLVAGPCMPRSTLERLREATARSERRTVLTFVPEADCLIRGAQRVVGMGGYNTICAVLSHDKPALIVLRTSPRAEQWIRAERLSRLGLIDILHPQQLSPAALSQWLRHPAHPPNARAVFDFQGLGRISQRLEELLRRPRVAGRRSSVEGKYEYAAT